MDRSYRWERHELPLPKKKSRMQLLPQRPRLGCTREQRPPAGDLPELGPTFPREAFVPFVVSEKVVSFSWVDVVDNANFYLYQLVDAFARSCYL